ncbi:hypothetical protein IEO21_08609 [Rhodonia placenta]|uniref:C2H2-type domain-containing protein n=1 Tax=Rhodonia placenta TaxID=104341 RepID=A0A8H7NVY5_9APHY|nr:hypothetical protein IEO21_08609 [Postia placenta]
MSLTAQEALLLLDIDRALQRTDTGNFYDFTGVYLRTNDRGHHIYPPGCNPSFGVALATLGYFVAVKARSLAIWGVCETLPANTHVDVDASLRVPMVDTYEDLVGAAYFHNAALVVCKNEQVLVVWANSADCIAETFRSIEHRLRHFSRLCSCGWTTGMLERVHALESHSDYAPDLSDGTQPDWAYSLRSECSDVSRPEDKSLSDLTLVIAEFEEMFVGSNMFSEKIQSRVEPMHSHSPICPVLPGLDLGRDTQKFQLAAKASITQDKAAEASNAAHPSLDELPMSSIKSSMIHAEHPGSENGQPRADNTPKAAVDMHRREKSLSPTPTARRSFRPSPMQQPHIPPAMSALGIPTPTLNPPPGRNIASNNGIAPSFSLSFNGTEHVPRATTSGLRLLSRPPVSTEHGNTCQRYSDENKGDMDEVMSGSSLGEEDDEDDGEYDDDYVEREKATQQKRKEQQGQAVSTATSTELHTATATNLQPHVCSVCGHRLSRYDALQRHMRTRHRGWQGIDSGDEDWDD